MNRLIFTIHFLFCIFLQAQNGSLEEQLSKASHDTIRCRLIEEHLEASYNFDEDFKWIQRFEKLVEKNLQNNKLSEEEQKAFLQYKVIVLGHYGYFYQNAKFPKMDLAISYHQQSMDLARQIDDQLGVASAYNNIAFAYEDIGRIKQAIENYDKSLQIYKRLKNDGMIAVVLNNLGFAFQSQRDDKKALKYFQESLTLRLKSRPTEDPGIALAYNNIGLIYSNSGDFDKGLNYYEKALLICRKINHKYGEALVLNNIGDNFLQRYESKAGSNSQEAEPELDKALAYFEQSLAIWNAEEDWESKAVTLKNIGTVYLRKNETEKAISYGKQSLELAQRIGFPKPVMSGSHLLYKAYKSKGDFEKALAFYELYETMDDSIVNEENRKQLIEKDLAYEFDKKEIILKEQTKAEKEQQRLVFVSIIGLLIFIMLLLFVWFYYHKKRKTAEKLLRDKELSLEIAVAERRRISADLHDDLGVGIAGIALLGNLISQRKTIEEVKEDTLKIVENTEKVSTRLTEVIWELNAEHDNLEHLLLFIQKQGNQLIKENGISFSMVIPLDVPDIILNGYKRKQIYLAVKECFHNIVKHAEASLVYCVVAFGDSLIIKIKDNGKGFDVDEKTVNATGEGLVNIQSRIESLKGETILVSSEKGTVVTFVIPLVKP